MYAPIFPTYMNVRSGRKVWHRVHPLDLVHAECSPIHAVLKISEIRDDLPPDADFCHWCARIESRRQS